MTDWLPYSILMTLFCLRKIIKMLVTRCQILRLKCTKFDFGWGYAPDPAGGAYSAPQTPYLDLRGPTSKGREGKEGRGREGRGKGRAQPPIVKSWVRHCFLGQVAIVTARDG